MCDHLAYEDLSSAAWMLYVYAFNKCVDEILIGTFGNEIW